MAVVKQAQALETLEMALAGYQAERQKIQARIAGIVTQLGGNGARRSRPIGNHAQGAAKRALSAAGRERIAAAQRKRWEEHRKQMAAAG